MLKSLDKIFLNICNKIKFSIKFNGNSTPQHNNYCKKQ